MRNLAGRKSDRYLVERFEQWIPGWGRRQLTLDSLGNLCDECGIVVTTTPLEGDGYAFWLEGCPFIYVNSLLPEGEQVVTLGHELAHVLYHPSSDDAVFLRAHSFWNWSKCDRQAEIVGCVAWMPDRMISKYMTIDHIRQEFGVRRETAAFRLSLDLWPGRRAA
jgi:Zn-dependent peptidase ImmA (M78 family)